MPQYIYIDDETGERFEVIQTMNEKHCFYNPQNGNECRRIWTVPNASIDSLSNTDPFNINSHIEKTGKMKGTVGDLWDASKEMSQRREEKLGKEDPIKRKFFDNYEKKNKVKHFKDRPTKIENKHAIIDYSAKTPEIKD